MQQTATKLQQTAFGSIQYATFPNEREQRALQQRN